MAQATEDAPPARRVLLKDEQAGKASGGLAPQTLRAWSLIGWAGVGLALIGLVDVILVWYPIRLGDPQWEFGSFTSAMNGLPLTALGLLLFMSAGLARGKKGHVRGTAVVLVLLVAAIVVAGAVYALTLPMATDAVAGTPAALGIKKAIAKTAAQTVLYLTIFSAAAAVGWRFTRTNL